MPRILVAQSLAPATRDGDPNVPIANYIGQEIDDGGKLTPVIWSMSDPIFREAALGGKLKDIPDHPKLADALSFARVVGADYVLICEAVKSGKEVKSSARLYRGTKEIWKGSESMGASQNGTADPFSSAQSTARTIVIKMSAAALKELTVQAKVVTPEPGRGQAPVPTTVTPPPVAKSDNSQLKIDLQEFLKDKHYASAVSLLRDAIDAEPFDPERRMMLVDLLKDRDPAAAAEEARRAETLIPDKPEFRVAAARAFMSAGKTKEALEELNEAIARAPEATATRLLLAELALSDGQPEKALPHLDEAIKNEPTAEAYFLRSLCRAMLGGADGVKLDLASMDKASPVKSPADLERRYKIAIPNLDKLLLKSFEQVRDLTQHAIVKPKDTDVQDTLETLQRLTGARLVFLQGLAVPPDFQKLHDRWLLSYKLLAQALSDLKTFTGGDADALTDARMNLGEAIKQATQARSASAG
ncbi:tetratricopeptide repeat protein [Fimbriimonas ginsengisoli]|uniref:Uncharacterized protein n=1 Tax=Fimbriimonas ginsengisoli Gsoil 348 TaxID=661478 RepID=A0A068NJK0_FIMGI|nr:tetratricopeptide repeat protein [Fimbriimonas ginsengisoli]AIE83622.1 hypothetical protein OP10G_0254 [Fimbriimonas ginsengisoli Gsoil 348]